jgi:hypothetical protein
VGKYSVPVVAGENVIEKLHVLLPKATVKFCRPELVGVPVPFKVTACTPVAVNVPVFEKLTPFTVLVDIVYVPIVVTVTWTVDAVLDVVKGTPCIKEPAVVIGVQTPADEPNVPRADVTLSTLFSFWQEKNKAANNRKIKGIFRAFM